MDGWMDGWMDGNASLAEYTHGLVFFFFFFFFISLHAGWLAGMACWRSFGITGWMDGSVGGLIEFSSYKEMKAKER